MCEPKVTLGFRHIPDHSRLQNKSRRKYTNKLIRTPFHHCLSSAHHRIGSGQHYWCYPFPSIGQSIVCRLHPTFLDSTSRAFLLPIAHPTQLQVVATPSNPPTCLSATSDLTSIPLFCFDFLRSPLPITTPSTSPFSPGLASAGRPLVCRSPHQARSVTPTPCLVSLTAWLAETGVRQTHWIRKSLEHRLSRITWAGSCNQTFHSLHSGSPLSSVKTSQTHVHPAARAHIVNPWRSGTAANAMRRRGNL